MGWRVGLRDLFLSRQINNGSLVIPPYFLAREVFMTPRALAAIAWIKYKYYQGNSASAPVPYISAGRAFYVFKNFHTACRRAAGQIAFSRKGAKIIQQRCDLLDTHAKKAVALYAHCHTSSRLCNWPHRRPSAGSLVLH